jgi:predicted exporter
LVSVCAPAARRGLRAPLAVGDAHGELLREELVELEPPPRRMRALDERLRVDVGRRAVQQQHALAERPRAQLPRARAVERVLEGAGCPSARSIMPRRPTATGPRSWDRPA